MENKYSLQRCTDCVFNFTNMKNCEGDGCMFNGVCFSKYMGNTLN